MTSGADRDPVVKCVQCMQGSLMPYVSAARLTVYSTSFLSGVSDAEFAGGMTTCGTNCL